MTQEQRETILRVIGYLWTASVCEDAWICRAAADNAEMLENMLNEDGKGE